MFTTCATQTSIVITHLAFSSWHKHHHSQMRWVMTSTNMMGDCVGECKYQIILLRGSNHRHHVFTQRSYRVLMYTYCTTPAPPSAPLLTLPVNKHLKFICHIHVIRSAFPKLPDSYITDTQPSPNVWPGWIKRLMINIWSCVVRQRPMCPLLGPEHQPNRDSVLQHLKATTSQSKYCRSLLKFHGNLWLIWINVMKWEWKQQGF